MTTNSNRPEIHAVAPLIGEGAVRQRDTGDSRNGEIVSAVVLNCGGTGEGERTVAKTVGRLYFHRAGINLQTAGKIIVRSERQGAIASLFQLVIATAVADRTDYFERVV